MTDSFCSFEQPKNQAFANAWFGLKRLMKFNDVMAIKLEVVSKYQIAFESKAQADEKAQHTLKYVSILKRPTTQLSDDRWGFEATSKNSLTARQFLDQHPTSAFASHFRGKRNPILSPPVPLNACQ
jgi:hypothetical protein